MGRSHHIPHEVWNREYIGYRGRERSEGLKKKREGHLTTWLRYRLDLDRDRPNVVTRARKHNTTAALQSGTDAAVEVIQFVPT